MVSEPDTAEQEQDRERMQVEDEYGDAEEHTTSETAGPSVPRAAGPVGFEELMGVVRSLQQEVAVLKDRRGSREPTVNPAVAVAEDLRSSGVAIRNPEPFSGDNLADSLEQFGFRLRQFFFHKGVCADASQSAVLGSALSGSAAKVYRTMLERHPAGFEPPSFSARWETLQKQFSDPREMQKARMAMRVLTQGAGTVKDYVQKFRNVQLRLIGVQEDELMDNFILGLCAEVRQRSASTGGYFEGATG